LYLLNETISQRFILTVTDTSNRPIDDVYVQVLRRYVLNNQTTYGVVEMMQPNVALGGTTTFVGIPNSVPYLFRVLRNNGNILYQSSASSGSGVSNLLLVDTELFLRIPLTDRLLYAYQQSQGVSFSLTNTSNAFWFSYNDANANANAYCLHLVTNTTKQSQCSTASSGVLSIAYTPTNNTAYYAYAEIQIGDRFFILGTPLQYKITTMQGSQTFGNMGWFVLLVVVMFAAVIFTVDIQLGLILIPLIFMAFGAQVLGMVAVSYVLSFVLILISIILLFVVDSEKLRRS
jgi:hypothetical protein